MLVVGPGHREFPWKVIGEIPKKFGLGAKKVQI